MVVADDKIAVTFSLPSGQLGDTPEGKNCFKSCKIKAGRVPRSSWIKPMKMMKHGNWFSILA